MSENNEKDTSRETISSIEETIEDLKKKIEEISKESEKKEEEKKLTIPEFKLTDEQKAKLDDIKTSTVKTVSDTIEKVKVQASDVSNNADVKKTIGFLKDNAVKAVDGAKAKIAEVYDNEHVQDTITKTNSMASNVREDLKKRYEENVSADMKERIENVGKSVSDSADAAVQKTKEFFEKPEVQDSLNKAKDFADKGVSAVKDLFDKKETKE